MSLLSSRTLTRRWTSSEPLMELREYLYFEHKYAVHLSPNRIIFRSRHATLERDVGRFSTFSLVRYACRGLCTLWGEVRLLPPSKSLPELHRKVHDSTWTTM